jgi:hypothetical protein
MEAVFEVLDLLWGEPGSVAPLPLVYQRRAPFPAVGRPPFHEAGAATAGDVSDLLHRVTDAVEAHGLAASAGRAVFTANVSHGQFLGLLFTQL